MKTMTNDFANRLRSAHSLINAGNSLSESCIRAGITPYLYKTHIERVPFAPEKQGRPRVDAARLEQARLLVVDGTTIAEACAVAGISTRSFSRHRAKTKPELAFTTAQIRSAIETVFEHASASKAQVPVLTDKLLSVLQVNHSNAPRSQA